MTAKEMLPQVERWIEYARPSRKWDSLIRSAGVIKRCLKSMNGEPVTGPMIEGWIIDQMQQYHRRATTARWYVEQIRQFLRWRNLEHPDAKIYLELKIRAPHRIMPAMRESQYLTLLERMKHEQSKLTYGIWWEYALRMGWWSGLRVGDIAHCRWNYLDWEHKFLRLTPIKTSRAGIEVDIPMPNEMMEFFKEWKQRQRDRPTGVGDSPYCSYEMLRAYDSQRGKTLYSGFRALADSVGIDLTFHSLRHAFITRNIAAGVPVGILSTITGQSISTLMSYVKPDLEDKRKALGYT